MASKPPLPDTFDLPTEVNGWVHDPESNKNAHVWTGGDAERSVGVFSSVGDRVRVAVFDDRVNGFCNRIQPIVRELDENGETEADGVAWAVERAVEWMDRHAPSEWDHPHVEEAVFDPPMGFELDRYYLEQREHIVCYRQCGEPRDVNLTGRPPESDPSLETRPYLYVECWRGSGNATVALAPWLRAHDNEKHEVVETPEECGLAVALKLAREWVRDQTGETRDQPAPGQSDLGAWTT